MLQLDLMLELKIRVMANEAFQPQSKNHNSSAIIQEGY